jgi:deoxycytidylate deaminase
MNAILNKNSTDVKGCTVRRHAWELDVANPAAVVTSWTRVMQIYVALFPCNECAKLIIQVSASLSSACR